MPYDEDLADRIRELVAADPLLLERKMFGGLAFLIGGHMAVAAGEGGIMVRVEPDETDRLITTTDAEPMEMRGRQSRGWVHVDDEYVDSAEQLKRWVDIGVAYARSLPPKS